MRPSSFVFVAIVGLWAAHLLPQWIRRRDALGAARGADRHSEALRVLGRRRRAGGAGRSSAPLLPSIPVVVAPVVEAPEPGPASLLDPELPAVPAGLPAGLPASDVAARRRRLVLLALAGSALLSMIGAAAGAVPAVLAVVAVLLLGLDLAALRMVAVARERRRVAELDRARRAAGAERARQARLAREASPARATEPAVPEVQEAVTQEIPVVPAPAASEPVAVDATWTPVPVPPPTYTLKPVAPRPQPAPLEPALDPAAQPAATAAPQLRLVPEPEVDLDSVLDRRRAVNG